MKHTINDIVIDIDWGKAFFIENHGSGCKDYGVVGIGDDGNSYSGDGTYQDDELIEVTDIEKI